MSKEAMKLALEALEDVQYYGWGQTERDYDARTAAITALREALAEQPAQTLPFGVDGGLVAIKTLLSRDPCVHANTAIQMIDTILAEQPAGSVYRYGKDSSGTPWHGIRWTASGLDLPDGTLIYTSPQPAQRKPLTDEQREEIAKGWRGRNWTVGDIIDAIEAAHGNKGDA